jgi:hypothetical protein
MNTLLCEIKSIKRQFSKITVCENQELDGLLDRVSCSVYMAKYLQREFAAMRCIYLRTIQDKVSAKLQKLAFDSQDELDKYFNTLFRRFILKPIIKKLESILREKKSYLLEISKRMEKHNMMFDEWIHHLLSFLEQIEMVKKSHGLSQEYQV